MFDNTFSLVVESGKKFKIVMYREVPKVSPHLADREF